MTEQESSDPEEASASTPDDVGDDDADRETAEAATSSGEPEQTEFEGDSPIDEDLVGRIEREDPESIAREIATLELEIDGLEAELAEREEEVDELTSKLKRKQADFENYKKRMKKRREEERQRATEDLIERLLDVRDNLQRALDQDEGADIRDGVESTLRQFDDVLDAEDVEPIEPAPGDDVDPHRHEVLARVDAEEPADAIASVHRPGYEMGEAVLREAQVTVSDGPAEEDTDEEARETTDATDEATEATEETTGAADEATETDRDDAS